jgi:hypothetical protein
MALLILQILLLAIGVGGAIVTAITLSNPAWRFRCVVGFGTMGVLGLVLTIVTYEETAGVPHLGDAWRWLVSLAVSLQRLPGFWLIVMFGGGVAIGAWIPRIHKKITTPRRRANVTAWFSPLEAIEKFTDPELLSKYNRAREREENLKKKVEALKDASRSELDEAVSQFNDATFVAERRHQEVIEGIIRQLVYGKLIAKGFKQLADGTIEGHETHITYWIIKNPNKVPLNFETRIADGYAGTFHNVSIGKNESYIGKKRVLGDHL